MQFTKVIILVVFTIFNMKSFAQSGVPVNGVADNYERITAFKNAVLVIKPGLIIKNAVVVIKKDKIIDAGDKVIIPQGAKVIDLNGKWIYPSFIDLWNDYGMPDIKQKKSKQSPQFLTSKEGAWYWNEAIHPEVNAYEQFSSNEEDASKLRKNGFGIVLSHQKNGIARGTGMLISLNQTNDYKNVLNPIAAMFFSFNKGNSTQDYPSSQMGSIALLRQFYYDALWYKTAKISEKNLSLDAFNKNSNLQQYIETADVQEALRANNIANEFGFKYIIKVNGDEYQFVNEIKNTNSHFLIPLNFPEPFDVENPFDAKLVSYLDLKHWEYAPFNPYILYKNNIEFSLSIGAMKNSENFLINLRKAVELGLPQDYALKALISNPAKLLKIENICGTIETGKLANFIITDGNLFDKKTEILENWILGEKNIVKNWETIDFTGKYNIKIFDSVYNFTLFGKPWTPQAEFLPKTKGNIKIALNNDFLNFSFNLKNGICFSGTAYKYGNNLILTISDSFGKTLTYTAYYIDKSDIEFDSAIVNKKIEVNAFSLPWKYNVPQGNTFIVKNCTVWTCDNQGTLENTDVFVKDGKIFKIGKNISSTGIEEIDGTGKHLTPGIIDEHSHIAISNGVNEGTQSVTSEVRIQDVINAKDVNIYRQLAGGVTTSHLLHGSANAVGGQTALIKLRYGEAPEKLKFGNEHKFIKFALGENVKQSNWGDLQTVRFPQTRMGVEQVYYDAFLRAKNYAETKKTTPYRTDLELEALLEILQGKRFITCHSYVQSEINMLMHVADTFGFKVNTFTHILEGYKVADKMKMHGASASSFSDWWAYKYEVVEAIPQNAGILNKIGINTAINSDDAEMGRRLNQEAAKSIKYSNMSETDALKMVTINPAKMLHIDNKVGSITIGKDADIVLWNNNPLSIYAKPLKTWIEGKIYFDINEDLKKRIEIAKDRQRLINAMIKAKKNGQNTHKAFLKIEPDYHCED